MRKSLQDITKRRSDVDDPHRERLTDNALEVLQYLRAFTGRDIPAEVMEDDILDGLLLALWIEREVALAQHFLLGLAIRRKVPRAPLCEKLGLDSGQAIVDRFKQKEKMLFPDGAPAAQAAARQADTAAIASLGERLVARAAADPRQPWLDRRRQAIFSLARTLLDHAEFADEDAYESLGEVRRDLDENVCTPGSFTQLSWAAEELATIAEVAALPESHPLARALHDFAALHGAWKTLASG